MEFVDTGLFYLGLLVNSALVMLALWGLMAFFPKKGLRGDTAASWLILAIWLGFFGVGAHTLYWRVSGDLLEKYGWFTQEQIVWFGRNVIDFVFHGMAVVSIYLHFYARYRSIGPEEQKQWSPLLMGFYPDLSHWAVRTSKRIQSLYERQPKP